MAWRFAVLLKTPHLQNATPLRRNVQAAIHQSSLVNREPCSGKDVGYSNKVENCRRGDFYKIIQGNKERGPKCFIQVPWPSDSVPRYSVDERKWNVRTMSVP